MFYSHKLLGRKTPLGTVWCAAHLQHRLNKKDYQNTQIPLVVDAIMYGEVPLALRTSSYLLLGVVRIYSKQIDYLKHDVDVLVLELRKMHSHASTILTLPENAYQAPFHSITLPETFDLDALELDSDVYDDGVLDTYLSSQEEITLADQISIGRDAYVAITFHEDVMMDLSQPGKALDLGFRSMEEEYVILPSPTVTTMNVEGSFGDEDILNMKLDEDIMPQNFPGVEVFEAMNVQEFDPSYQSVRNDDNSPQSIPEVEVLREAEPDFSPRDIPMASPLGGDDTSEPCRLIDENLNQENLLQIMEDEITLPKTSLPFEQSPRPSTSLTSQEALDMNDKHISFRQSPMELVLQPTPQQPKPRSRKRKQFFDKSTAFTNKFLKKALEDSSDLLRKTRNLPSSSLEAWKLNNLLRKEEVFSHPSITGLCHDLDNIFKVDYITTKCHTVLMEQAFEDLGDAKNTASSGETFLCQTDAPSPAPEATSPPHTEIPTTADPASNIASASGTSSHPVASPSRTREDASSTHFKIPPTVDPSSSFSEMEIEHLRNVEGNQGDYASEDLIASPPRFMPSPKPSEGLGSPSSVIASAGMISTPGPVSTETSRSMFETPWTIDEGLGTKSITPSNVPEQMNMEDENLYFLEADSSPASRSSSRGTRGTRGVDLLSVRTRAVGRYLRSLSPIKSISDDSTQDQSLDDILEGNRRKLCVRMFYEILVLKSYDLIGVQQDLPYGDITLKISKLSEYQI